LLQPNPLLTMAMDSVLAIWMEEANNGMTSGRKDRIASGLLVVGMYAPRAACASMI